MDPEHLQANRAMWDERVPIHAESDLYDVPGFLAGSSRLCDFEVTELGRHRLEIVLNELHVPNAARHRGPGLLERDRLG